MSACSQDIDGHAVSQRTTPSIRQTDAQGRPLPFVTKFPNRWNPGNNGTTYEPCTALTSGTLRTLGLDPTSASEAAVVDGQTLRGCQWTAPPPLGNDLAVSQFIGNSGSVEAYKTKYKGLVTWLPDQTFQGRTIAVGDDYEDGCFTYVQSGQAGVITQHSYVGRELKSQQELCDMTLAFTRATIPFIPE